MRARKRFAQHFLEPAWVNKLVAAVAATPDDSILEIGPGRGAITRPLAAQAGTAAGDRDRSRSRRRPRSRARCRTSRSSPATCCRSISCRSSPSGSARRPVRRTSSASSATCPTTSRRRSCFALLDLAATTNGVRDAMLMLQKEVADRLVAKVGTGEYGVLTVLTALNADVTRVLSLPPGRVSAAAEGAFRRRSAGVPAAEGGDRRPRTLFVRMVRTMFTQRRKTLGNALEAVRRRSAASTPAEALAAAGIDPQAPSGDARAGRNGRACARAVLSTRRKLKLCYSFRRNPPVFTGAPSGLNR